MGAARIMLTNAAHFLEPEGLLLLGINTTYIPRTATLTLVEKCQDLELRDVVEYRISSSEVYVVGHMMQSYD